MKKTALLVSAAALLALAGCPSPSPAPAAPPTSVPPAAAPASTRPPAPVPAATKAPAAAASSAATATPAAEPATAPAPQATDETVTLTGREEGLDQLKSYRAQWHAEWKSTEAGKDDSGTWDWTEEYVSSPAAIHWVWSTTGSDAVAGVNQMEIWQTEQATFMRTPGSDGNSASCMSFSDESQTNEITKGIFDLNTLGSVSNAKLVGTEAVNGIQSKHYRYDQNSAHLLGMGQASGDIWVAVDGGYTVKDTLKWQGAAGFLGLGSDGTGEGSWTWELTDVNQPITVAPPEDCARPATDIPVMADASEKGSFGEMLTYKSQSSVKDVAAFYKDEMAKAGWTAGDVTELGEDMVTLSFSKDDRKVTVMLSKDSESTSVMVTTGN